MYELKQDWLLKSFIGYNPFFTFIHLVSSIHIIHFSFNMEWNHSMHLCIEKNVIYFLPYRERESTKMLYISKWRVQKNWIEKMSNNKRLSSFCLDLSHIIMHAFWALSGMTVVIIYLPLPMPNKNCLHCFLYCHQLIIHFLFSLYFEFIFMCKCVMAAKRSNYLDYMHEKVFSLAVMSMYLWYVFAH